MHTPWKTEYAIADSFGDEFFWSDDQAEAMREAKHLVDSGQYEELTIVEIQRFSDLRSDLLLYSQGFWDC